MKRFINIVLPLVLLLSACERNFEEINTNPNAPTEVDPSFLFAQAEKATFDDGSFYNEALLHSYLWTQQFSDKTAAADIFQRNEFAVSVNSQYWSQFYIAKMPNIADIKIKLNAEPASLQAIHANRRAMVDIIQVLNAHYVVDMFGAIPYSEAFKAFDFNDQNFLPKYDEQQSIYLAMLSQLKEASSLLSTDASQENFSADLWFNNDISKWKKLANSLRLRLAMRISDADQATARSVINELLAHPEDLISSNSDNLVFRYTGSDFNSPLYAQARAFMHGTAAAKNFVDFLKNTGDPRLRIFFNKATQGPDAGTYVGVPVSPDARDAAGLFSTGSGKDYNSKYSRGHAQAWFNLKFPELVINYAEVLLLRAEIAQKGWSGENAKQLYEEGITASIQFYSSLYKEAVPYGDNKNPDSPTDNPEMADINSFDVSPSEISALLAAPGVKYDPGNAANQIGVQQWINHHRNPRELLSNFRRTDIPNSTSVPAWETIVASGNILPESNVPKRLTYPASEYASNSSNLESILSIQGPDQETTRLWWDKH
jgi:hypothetical protein